MSEKKKPEKDRATPRKKSKKALKRQGKNVSQEVESESQRLIHELETHRIELEMQNEELRQAQEELEASRARYSDLYDYAPVGYFTFDKKGRIEEVNLAGAALLGIDRKLVVSKLFESFIVFPDHRIFQEYTRQALETGTNQVCEVRLKQPDGSQIHARLRSIRPENNRKSQKQLRTVVTDITELKKAEAAVALLSKFPERNPHAVVEVDLAGTVQYINPAAERLFPELQKQGSEHAWLKDFEKIVATLADKGVETYQRESKTGDRWYDQTFTYIEEDQCINVYGLEITAQKQAQEETARSLRDLEFMSSAATHFLRPMSRAHFFHAFGKRLVSLTGEALVVISEYNESEGTAIIRGVFGDKKGIEKVRDLIQWNPIGESFVVADETRRDLYKGRLVKLAEKLQELTFNQLPDYLCEQIEQSIDLGEIYGMPLLDQKRNFLGLVNVFTKKNHDLANLPAVKTLIGLGAIALNRIKAEEELQRALREQHKRTAEISAMFKGSRAILEHHEFQDAAKSIYDACKSIIGATAGYIALMSENGQENELLFVDAGNISCTVAPSLRMPIRGMREKVISQRKVLYDNDFAQSEFVKLLPDGHAELENVLFAPLLIGDEIVGLLGLANKPGGFVENDMRIASAFADLAAIAFGNSRTLGFLKSSEERYRSLVQTAHDAIIAVDAEGTILSWNRGATAIFGYSAEEVIGEPLTAIMPEAFRDAHQAAMNRVVKTGKSTIMGKTVEVCGLRKDGSEVPIELSLTSMETKGTMMFTGIIRDITLRKQAEEARQKAREELEQQVAERTADLTKANTELRAEIEERKRVEKMLNTTSELLKRMFSSIDVLVAYMDRDFNFIRVNRAYAEADGRTPRFYVGKKHFALFPNEENEAIFKRVVETGKPFFVYEKPFEYAEHPERGVTYWDWSLQPVKESGAVTGVVLSLVNVTQRKMAEKALAESEERFRLITERSLDVIGLTDMDGQFVYVNPAGMSVLGYSIDELLEMNSFDLMHPHDKVSLGDWQSMPQVEFRAKKANGEWIWLEGSTYTIALDGQDYVVGIFKDVTFRKYAEQALRRSQLELRHLSSKLITVQEQERRKIARDIHDSIGQSLAAIKFRIEQALRRRKVKGEEADRGSLEGIIPLVQESINEARRIQTDLRPPSLDDLGIVATISWFCRQFHKSYPGIGMETRLDLEETSVSDRLKIVIYRICQEALNNVAKHSDATKVEVYLGGESDAVELRIHDNGKGFELDQTLSEKYTANRMGLVSMKERAELSGGSFTIETAKGRGTTIRCFWPSFRIMRRDAATADEQSKVNGFSF